MKNTNPIHSFPFYVADWLNSETRMKLSPAQRGIYLDLIVHLYASGSIPAEDAVLARMAGISIDEWMAEKEAILPLFKIEKDRLKHHKVDAVRRKLLQYKLSRKEAGSKGGKRRAEKVNNLHVLDIKTDKPQAKLELSSSKNKASEVAELKPSSSSSSSTSTSSTSSSSKEESNSDGVLEIVEAIIERHPNSQKMTVQEIVQQLISIQKPTESILETALVVDRNHQDICAAHESLGGWKGREPKYVPSLRKWMTTQARDPTIKPKPISETRAYPEGWIG